jgi:hypothetical protein
VVIEGSYIFHKNSISQAGTTRVTRATRVIRQ